jgi:iron complex transport system ATP-binding protein
MLSEKIITLSHVYGGYDQNIKDKNEYVLKDLSLDIEEGKCLCILGSNGSGKTTLLRTIAGMIPSEGEITLCGKNMRTMPRKEIASYIAFLSQISRVYFSYNVYDTIMQGRYVHGGSGFVNSTASDRRIVEETLESLGLTDIRNRQITKLSGGQLQRVFLARAIAQKSPILLLDEPMNHLDLKVQAEFLDYLNDWREKEITLPDGRTYKPTIIGVFHDISIAADIADDVVMLKNGRVLFSGKKDEILNREMLKEGFDFDVAGNLAKRNEKIMNYFL